jgi:hypothetical protein
MMNVHNSINLEKVVVFLEKRIEFYMQKRFKIEFQNDVYG